MNRKRIEKFLTEKLGYSLYLENYLIIDKYQQEIKKIVDELLDLTKTNILNLSNIELKIIRLRFGIFNNGRWQPFENIAKYLKISRETSIIFYKNALYKIKKYLTNVTLSENQTYTNGNSKVLKLYKKKEKCYE